MQVLLRIKQLLNNFIPSMTNQLHIRLQHVRKFLVQFPWEHCSSKSDFIFLYLFIRILHRSLPVFDNPECCICMDNPPDLILSCEHRLCEQCFQRWFVQLNSSIQIYENIFLGRKNPKLSDNRHVRYVDVLLVFMAIFCFQKNRKMTMSKKQLNNRSLD